MSFTVILPGQPPSGNHMYEGYGKNRHKTSDVSAYQEAVAWLVKAAMPRGWRPGPDVVIEFRLLLNRAVDATNVMKVIEDGIGEALCDGDRPPMCCRRFDDRFLCRAMSRVTGVKQPYVEITIS